MTTRAMNLDPCLKKYFDLETALIKAFKRQSPLEDDYGRSDLALDCPSLFATPDWTQKLTDILIQAGLDPAQFSDAMHAAFPRHKAHFTYDGIKLQCITNGDLVWFRQILRATGFLLSGSNQREFAST